MRLIDADAFEINMQNEWERNEISNGEWIHFREMINNEPTIEAVTERKKGRWVDCVGSDHWRCSKCGDRAPMYWDANRQEYDEWFSPYCPNCGCAMTEGAEE